MRRFYTDDSLEEFLKQNADGFQMRPSDKVWNGIQDNLRRRKRRFGWIGGLFLISATAGTYFLAQEQGTGGSASVPAASAQAMAAHQQPQEHTAIVEQLHPTAAATRNEGNPATNQPGAGGTLLTGNGQPNSLLAALGSGHNARNQRVPGRNAAQAAKSLATQASASRTALSDGDSEHQNTAAADALPGIVRKIDLVNAPSATEETGNSATRTDRAGSKMSLQFFFTPTVSYRTLTTTEYATGDMAPATGINDMVTHKPNIGLEVGLTAKYPLSRILKVQGGLQLNMSRYDVQAFDNPQPQLATIAVRGPGAQLSQTQYTNGSGTSDEKDWLQNMYFQVSAPIGLELRLAGNDRTQFGIASTIQPTYIVSDRVFMLSTDYKSYTEAPWLIRRWNLNTAFSTYVGYSTGKLAWQVGPQIRYQMLSSFTGKYPLRENLFDFGLRVGMSINPKR